MKFWELCHLAAKDDATAQDFTAAIVAKAANQAIDGGKPLLPLEEFFNEQRDWPHVVAARTWWPKTILSSHTWFQAVQMAIASHANPYPPLRSETLLKSLTAAAERATKVLVAAGGDPRYPNETKAERNRRVNRERVAQWRADNKRETIQENAHVVSARNELNDIRRARKDAIGVLADQIRTAQAAMMDLVTKRNDLTKQWDERVQEAQVAYDTAKTTNVVTTTD